MVNYVMFDVTDYCNFRCKHCYKNQPDECLDLDLMHIKKFIKMLQSRGINPNIVLSGGEPFLHNQLYDILDYVCDGRSVRVNTNGILLDENNINKLKKYKNLKIQVSLDGYDKESFFEVRNNDGFDCILKNTVMAFKTGLDIYFRATITNKTINSYEKFIDLSKKVGVPLIMRAFYNTGEVEQQELKVEFAQLCDWQENIIKKNQIKYTGGRNLLAENSCPLIRENVRYSTLTVDNHGRVYPCQLLRTSKFYMGNIITDSFENIFADYDKRRDILKKIIDSDSCNKCGFRKNIGDGTCVPSCFVGNRLCVKEKI